MTTLKEKLLRRRRTCNRRAKSGTRWTKPKASFVVTMLLLLIIVALSSFWLPYKGGHVPAVMVGAHHYGGFNIFHDEGGDGGSGSRGEDGSSSSSSGGQGYYEHDSHDNNDSSEDDGGGLVNIACGGSMGDGGSHSGSGNDSYNSGSGSERRVRRMRRRQKRRLGGDGGSMGTRIETVRTPTRKYQRYYSSLSASSSRKGIIKSSLENSGDARLRGGGRNLVNAAGVMRRMKMTLGAISPVATATTTTSSTVATVKPTRAQENNMQAIAAGSAPITTRDFGGGRRHGHDNSADGLFHGAWWGDDHASGSNGQSDDGSSSNDNDDDYLENDVSTAVGMMCNETDDTNATTTTDLQNDTSMQFLLIHTYQDIWNIQYTTLAGCNVDPYQPPECQRNLQGDAGKWVCRTVYNPVTGVAESFTVCIDPVNAAWAGDSCGCCDQVCPAACHCSCDMYRTGDHKGVLVQSVDTNDSASTDCQDPAVAFTLISSNLLYQCDESCGSAAAAATKQPTGLVTQQPTRPPVQQPTARPTGNPTMTRGPTNKKPSTSRPTRSNVG